MARYANPALEMKTAEGKMCEPLLKSQRMEGRERDAGWDFSSGISKRDSAAMPPPARREMVMLAA